MGCHDADVDVDADIDVAFLKMAVISTKNLNSLVGVSRFEMPPSSKIL